MTASLRVFVSSVQKELEDERLIVQNLVNTDPFLAAHCVPILYEFEPASLEKALDGCLRALDECQVYLLIVGVEYGSLVGTLSITHAEYRRAKLKGFPVLAFIKGDRQAKRADGTIALLAELDADGPKYKRFGNVIELQKQVRAALVKLLLDRFGIAPTSDENLIAEHQEPSEMTEPELLDGAALRGLVWHDPVSGQHFATAAGVVLLAKDPSAVFPQCRILADAYRSTEPDGDPRDHEDIRAPMPLAVERAVAFVDRNTRHPMRIVGLNRIRLDEYPVEALREGLVNAVAHRQYEDGGRKIMLEVFSDRVVLSSPGLPPKPITLASLRKGKYRPCSRNPVLAQGLSYFHRIEERGSGFRRMTDQMLDHGLDRPILGTDTGYFQISFPGPAENVERLRVPESRLVVTPAVEAQLNERQRRMMQSLVEGKELTSRQCEAEFGVTRPITSGDLGKLVELGLAERLGAGRSTRYRLKGTGESSTNRQGNRSNRKPAKDGGSA